VAHTPKRTYNSPRRQQQAAATRQAILEAAERLFLRDGYAATTMEAIGNEAGVSLKTVYLPFATKSGLLRAAWDLRLKGDQSGAPVVDSDWFRAVINESDPIRKLQLNARGSRSVKSRIDGMFAVIRGAAEIDADCRDLWELIQSDFHDLQAMVVNTLHRSGALRPALTAHHGTDILWTLNHPDVWILLVEKRGWSPASYETWLAEASCSQLLGTTSSCQHP
jgi:AcrR family transcriptional regulator